MATKDRMAVLAAMMDQGVIPVFYHPDVEVCKKVIQACANGGAKCIEFTNRGDFAAQRVPRRRAPFRQGRSQRDHGRGLGRRCADGGHVHRQWRQVRRRADPQRRRRQGLQPPQDSLQPGLRLGLRDSATPRNWAARSSRCSPAARVGGPEFVKNVLGPMPVDAHHAHRRRRDHRRIADASGSAPASSRAASARTSSPRSCSASRTTPASRRSVRDDHRTHQAHSRESRRS